MLLHCNNYAFKKPPSYPPWGKIDYALRLRFFLSFILAFLSFFLSSFLPQGRSLYLASPYRGKRGGLSFLFIYIYISLFI